MRILIVSPFFAPYSGVGAVRMTSLATSLVNNGHDVTVLALSEEYIRNKNKNEASALPVQNIRIIRYDVKPHMRQLVEEYVARKSLKKKLEEFLDQYFVDIIVVSVGPYYTFTPIKDVCMKRQIPYVIDYRDLGVLEDAVKYNSMLTRIKAFIYKNIAGKKERVAAEEASRLIAVTLGDVERLKHGFNLNHVEVVFNGYDEKRLSGITITESEKSVFYIGYVGKLLFYAPERTYALLRAIRDVRAQGHDVRLLHVGTALQDTKELLEEIGLDEVAYEYHGSLDYAIAMQTISKSSMFYIEYAHPSGLGTKIFDYIYLNKPVLVAAPEDCYLGRFVDSLYGGFHCCDAESISRALAVCLSGEPEHLLDDAEIKKYSREIQNQKYESILLTVVNEYKAMRGDKS